MNIEETEREFGNGSQINPESYREHVNELADEAVALIEGWRKNGEWNPECQEQEIRDEFADGESSHYPWLKGPRNCLGVLLSASNPNEAIREDGEHLIPLDYSDTWDCALYEMASKVMRRDVCKAILEKLELTEARAKLKAAGFHVTE